MRQIVKDAFQIDSVARSYGEYFNMEMVNKDDDLTILKDVCSVYFEVMEKSEDDDLSWINPCFKNPKAAELKKEAAKIKQFIKKWI